jgi:hypothetical protein
MALIKCSECSRGISDILHSFLTNFGFGYLFLHCASSIFHIYFGVCVL